HTVGMFLVFLRFPGPNGQDLNGLRLHDPEDRRLGRRDNRWYRETCGHEGTGHRRFPGMPLWQPGGSSGEIVALHHFKGLLAEEAVAGTLFAADAEDKVAEPHLFHIEQDVVQSLHLDGDLTVSAGDFLDDHNARLGRVAGTLQLDLNLDSLPGCAIPALRA